MPATRLPPSTGAYSLESPLGHRHRILYSDRKRLLGSGYTLSDLLQCTLLGVQEHAATRIVGIYSGSRSIMLVSLFSRAILARPDTRRQDFLTATLCSRPLHRRPPFIPDRYSQIRQLGHRHHFENGGIQRADTRVARSGGVPHPRAFSFPPLFMPHPPYPLRPSEKKTERAHRDSPSTQRATALRRMYGLLINPSVLAMTEDVNLTGAQLKVVRDEGSGPGKLPPASFLAKFPGAYSPKDPGLTVNLYTENAPSVTTYEVPGPRESSFRKCL